jgi:hypothetical protein
VKQAVTTLAKPCKHRFRFTSYSGRGRGGRKFKYKVLKKTVHAVSVALTFGFRCDKCGEAVERKATPKERALHEKRVDWQGKPSVHKTWYEFQRHFKKDDAYRFTGYDLMVRVEKWARKHPHEVRCLSIDDSAFASSTLLLVEHRHTREYMGTTAVVIPQCTGEKPIEFFMYPSHRDEIIAALVSIRAAARTPTKRQRMDEITESRLTRKFIRHPPVI